MANRVVTARLGLVLVALAVLPSCAPGVAVIYDGSRQASKPLIGQALAESTPGIDQDAGAECLIAAMSFREIIELGTSDSRRVTAAYRTKVTEVKARPGVAGCLAAVPVRG